MPTFKPFRAIYPSEEYQEKFPTPSLVLYSLEELALKAREENTFINMVKPYVVSKSKDVDRNLRKIRSNFESILEQKILLQDSEASFYFYMQIMPDKTVYRGLLGLTSIEDFQNGKIKKHEATIKDRKEKFAHYLSKVNLQSEPVLLTYESNSKLELFMDKEEHNIPMINFVSDLGVRHKIWKIDNRLKMQQIKEVLGQMNAFYIGDGHHRIGSAALNAELLNAKSKKRSGNEGYNFVYSYIVSKDSFQIHDYNRLVKSIGNMSTEEFLKKIEEKFLIHEKGETPYYPSQKFHISLYIDGQFYSLHLKHHLRMQEEDGNDMDHFFVEKYIFDEILGIKLESESDNIEYIKGTSDINGIMRIKEQVDSGKFKAGLGIYPISFKDLLKVSDKEIKMPPKCTNVDPKLVTALLMYDMK